MVKAIFFDIDGTLVSFETHRIPVSTVEAFDRLRERGIRLFVASGRHRAVMNNLGTLRFDGYVTLNGGVCLAGDEVIYERFLPEADIESLVRYLEGSGAFPCVFVDGESSCMNYRDEATETIFRLMNFPVPPVRALLEIAGKRYYQLLAFFRKEEEERIMRVIPGCEATRWNPLFTDIVPAGSSKRVGLAEMCRHYGLRPEETMAFGDGGNDIEMLRFAGIGVAMGNAAEEVKGAVDYVTASVDEDGIARALRHFGLI